MISPAACSALNTKPGEPVGWISASVFSAELLSAEHFLRFKRCPADTNPNFSTACCVTVTQKEFRLAELKFVEFREELFEQMCSAEH